MEEERLIAKIAYLYYFENMDLKAIGSLFGVSYATISRLLKKGREDGIINIVINSQYEKEVELEEELKNTLGLKEIFSVYIEEQYSYDNILNLLGIEAARYFSSILKDGDNLGVSLGRTIYNVINHLRDVSQKKVNLIQLFGHTPWFPIELTSFDFINRLQSKYKWSYNIINTEILADDRKAKKILMNSKSIKKVFKLHKNIDVGLISVGEFNPQLPYFYHENYLKKEELNELIENKIVGESVFSYFDIEGNIYDMKLSNRMICISTENLRKIKNKILVSGGPNKTEAILGAARAGLVDTLITDSLNVKKISEILNIKN